MVHHIYLTENASTIEETSPASKELINNEYFMDIKNNFSFSEILLVFFGAVHFSLEVRYPNKHSSTFLNEKLISEMKCERNGPVVRSLDTGSLVIEQIY